jgi:hypothetical protein
MEKINKAFILLSLNLLIVTILKSQTGNPNSCKILNSIILPAAPISSSKVTTKTLSLGEISKFRSSILSDSVGNNKQGLNIENNTPSVESIYN